MSARVFQLNVSEGGVPKRPVPQAHLDEEGLEGDGHRFPDVHGGPTRALCLYSLERILLLQEEGHPVYPGALGENVTTIGLDWDALELGMRLQIGPDVIIEITKHTAPCRTIAGAFNGRAFGRIAHANHPGWSRLYARVLTGGVLAPGQVIQRMPASRDVLKTFNESSNDDL